MTGNVVRKLPLLIVAAAALLISGAARAAYPGVHPKPLFATPGKAAYCTVEPTNQEDGSPKLFCWTPNDGFGVQISWRASTVETYHYTKPPEIVHGTAVLRGYAPRTRVVSFGQTFEYGCGDPARAEQCSIGIFASTVPRASLVCNDVDSSGVTIGYVRPAPTSCTVLPPQASFAEGANLAGLRWSQWGAPVASADGYELGFHLPLSHIPVIVRADKLARNRCGGGLAYSRLRITSRYGTALVHPQVCPAPGVTAFTCTSATTGLTCRNAAHHGFWLGRNHGFRRF